MSYWNGDGGKFSDLLGKVIAAIESTPEQIKFATQDGDVYVMDHSQDCCESVTVEDICGDLNDLIGSPILEAEESTSEENPAGVNMGFQDSFTWTFYKLRTIKGGVTIRWYGESNGFYSEGVDFYKLKKTAPPTVTQPKK